MSKLKIAIQKKGRLYEESIQLLKESGLNFKEGVQHVISTDIDKDGMLNGPAFNLYTEILKEA
ncbi:hypothetical protein FT993_02980 [Mesonia sp. HuA40]|nr:hypothetical protein FT993_02980 [Mesonia sp. HuA40]